MTTRTRSRHPAGPASALLLCALLLSACGGPAPSAPAPTPTTPVAQTPTPPSAQPSVLTPLGLLRVTFSHIGADDASATSTALSPLTGQALSDTAAGLQLVPVSSGSFVIGTRGAGGLRYLYATFKVRNATSAGAAYGTARTNPTLVAVSTPSSVNGTALSAMLKYDGSAVNPALAPQMLPTHAMTFDRASDAPRVLSGGEDLQLYADGETAALGLPSGVTRVLPYGFVIRNPSTPGSRTLPASPGAAQYDGVVTLAMKVPLQASAADDPFNVSLTLEAVDDSVTRVSESVEEQGAGSSAAARAALLGPSTQVATLCGTTLSGPNAVFLGSVTTAGAAGLDRQAHLGGNLALQTVGAGPYSVVGNTTRSVPAASGVLSNYAAYPAAPGGAVATLSAASAPGSTPGSNSTLNSDGSFTFTPKVGDGTGSTETLGYRVSDNAGCTSPALSANVPVSGRVWYVDNTVAGGDGRSDSPFQGLSSVSGVSSAGDTVYVAHGSGATSSAGFTLKASQRLIGGGVPLTLGAATLRPADPAGAPTLSGAGLTLAQDNELAGLTVNATGGAGIFGTSFGTLTTSAVSVTAAGGPALDLTSGTLAASFSKLSSSNSPTHGVNLTNTPGSLSVTGDGSTAGSGGTISGALQNGVNVTSTGAAPSVALNWMNISGNKNYGVLYTVPSASSSSTAVSVSNSVLSDNTNLHVLLDLGGSGAANFTLTGNTLSNPTTGTSGALQVNAKQPVSATVQGRVTNNTITLNSGSFGTGIATYVTGAGHATVQLSGNTIKSFGTFGIDLATQVSSGSLDATVSNNVIALPSALALEGMRLNAGDGTAGESSTLCVNLIANSSVGNEGVPGNGLVGYQIRQRPGTLYKLQGYSGGSTDATAIANFIRNTDITNPKSGARVRTVSNVSGGTCATPTF
ncbi:VcbS (plasmid) [Deinococcus sp. KNUC1210]|uniref:VcbS n=1 Tax=Deinococcus sp. KNUC1210 TaxID=2917691 RepID=UPI001EF157A6|nr:VcbS [Deinococcus sp. KNUC1210]ULH14123.1 VcbS [Deinococcus sp. KNUC1210]